MKILFLRVVTVLIFFTAGLLSIALIARRSLGAYRIPWRPADTPASFQRFYFDKALSSSSAGLPSLKSFAKNGRILFGTDFPLCTAAVAASFTAKRDAYDDLTADENVAIDYGNAWTLFLYLAVARRI